MRWFLIAMIAVLVLAHRSEQAMSRANTFSIHGKYLGVSLANDLWLRTDLTKKYSWMRMHGTCCVKQIHVLKTGEIIGVGLDRYDLHLILLLNRLVPILFTLVCNSLQQVRRKGEC